MRPNLIIVLAPFLHIFPGILQVKKLVLVQALFSEASVERIDQGIIGWFSLPTEIQSHSVQVCP